MNVKLIIPNCNRNTTPVVQYGGAIADIAGGFTATPATGGWKDSTGALVVEAVTVFDCYLPDEAIACNANSGQASVGPLVRFHDLATRIARELHQECVYLQIDDMVEFVKG
jgi:hypothetical protein